jgi:predicted metal-dependent phosphoesterase TrpH
VRRDPRAGADPDALDRLAVAEVDVVGLVQPVEIILHVDRREIDRRARRGLPSLASIPAKISGKVGAAGAEVHAHRFVVEQPVAAPGSPMLTVNARSRRCSSR